VYRVFSIRSFAQETPSPASQWVWTVSYGYHEGRTPTRGYAESREAAMQAFAKSCHRE